MTLILILPCLVLTFHSSPRFSHPSSSTGSASSSSCASATPSPHGEQNFFSTLFYLLQYFPYRYGALAGFGLSLSKWTLIVKRSTQLVRDENAWLWWLVLAFGFLICVRACTQVTSTAVHTVLTTFQYVQIKRSWRHLSSAARERLFFFY